MNTYIMTGYYEREPILTKKEKDMQERGLDIDILYDCITAQIIQEENQLIINSLNLHETNKFYQNEIIKGIYDVSDEPLNKIHSFFNINTLQTKIQFIIPGTKSMYIEAKRKKIDGTIIGTYKGYWTHISNSIFELSKEVDLTQLMQNINPCLDRNEKKRFTKFQIQPFYDYN